MISLHSKFYIRRQLPKCKFGVFSGLILSWLDGGSHRVSIQKDIETPLVAHWVCEFVLTRSFQTSRDILVLLYFFSSSFKLYRFKRALLSAHMLKPHSRWRIEWGVQDGANNQEPTNKATTIFVVFKVPCKCG